MKPFGLFARLKQTVDFAAIDEQPVDLIFVVMLPADHGEQITALASAARRLRDRETLARLRKAPDADALYRILTGATAQAR